MDIPGRMMVRKNPLVFLHPFQTHQPTQPRQESPLLTLRVLQRESSRLPSPQPHTMRNFRPLFPARIPDRYGMTGITQVCSIGRTVIHAEGYWHWLRSMA